MVDEYHLVQASQRGDCGSFEKLVEHYQSMVCAITYSATGFRETSEELAQEAFLRAWKNLSQLKDISKFRFWLCGITRNLIQTYYQQKRVEKVSVCDHEALENLAADTAPSPVEILVNREQEMILNQALMQIPQEYREPLVLFYRQQQSTKEVADILELNEATVRTRLSRGRQMLREEVSVMVERTLEQTAPNKMFTRSVMAAIGGGLAAGAAATATAAAATLAGQSAVSSGMAAGGAAAATTGFLTAAGVKVAAIAAAVIIGAGAIVYQSWRPSHPAATNEPATAGRSNSVETGRALPISQSSAMASQETMAVPPAVSAEKDQDVTIPSAKQVIPQQDAKPLNRHPDWPGIDESLKYVYMEINIRGIDGKESQQKFWAHLPSAFRDETESEKIIIDNGQQRLVLDPNSRQARIEPSWYRDGKMVWQFQQLIDEQPAIKFASIVRDPNSNPEYVLARLKSDSLVTVYAVTATEASISNGIELKMWVDNRTLLPEKMEAVVTGEPNQFGNMTNMSLVFDYSPFSDAIFSVDIPAEYKALQPKQAKSFQGHVIDLLGNPVAGAEVRLVSWEFAKRGPYTATSDKNGSFNVIMPQNEYGVNYTASLWAKLPGNPDFAAWTLLRCPQDLKDCPVLGGIVPGNSGVIYPSEDYRVETTDKGTITYGSWCAAVTDIVLVMEPGVTISGFVTDASQKPVLGAVVDADIYNLTDRMGNQITSIHRMPEAGFFRTVTDQRGYYEIRNFPRLWKRCAVLVHVNPAVGQTLIADEKRMAISDPNQPIRADFVLLEQGPTVRGIVVDNYGTPLPERYIDIQVNRKSVSGKLTKTDNNGRFEFKHCPADTGLQIKAELSHNSMAPHEPEKYNSYVYYPDVTVNVGYQPGQDEYEVKLVATKPEIEIEAILVDSAGDPLPYCVVEIRADAPLSTQWLIDRKLEGRADEHGVIHFVNVPDMKGLRLVCSYSLSNNIFDSQQSPEMQEHFKQLENNNTHHWTEAFVPLEPGETKYQMTIIIPTEEEYKRQKANRNL